MSSRQWIDWELIIMMDIIVPVMVGIKRHDNQVTASTAIGVALFSLVACHCAFFIGIKLRNRSNPTPLSKHFVAWAVVLAVLSACAAVWAVESFPPQAVRHRAASATLVYRHQT
jgi:hypothetical protein